VVLADADLDLAVRGAVFGTFLHQGQICMAINRLIVDAAIYDEFVDRFKARVTGLKCGNPSEPDTAVGPLTNAQQLQRLLERIEQALAEGARQILGGAPQGLVLPPHLLRGRDQRHVRRCRGAVRPRSLGNQGAWRRRGVTCGK
jgi:aldehyde dehydrogenase (NAD+)